MSLASTSRSYGQNETLISSIRNILKDYSHESIFKEFLQNADDAGATRFHVIIDSRSYPTSSLLTDKMGDWQGPAILLFNNAQFSEHDFDSLMKIRVGGKHDDDTKIGKHGLGFNSCYHFTDVPSFLSGDSIAFLDPQEKFLPMKNGFPQHGIICPFPPDPNFSEKDQLAPFIDIEGINFQSKFNGVLFRIPLRQKPSEISDRIFSIKEIRELFENIKLNITSYFLFLRNIVEIEVSYFTTKSPFRPRFVSQSLWKATVKNLDKKVKVKRKNIVNGKIQVFQIEVELIDNLKNKKTDHWIIATGAQKDPENPELQKYAKQYRLRVLGGVATLLKTIIDDREENKSQSEFKGRIFSFFPLPDTTCLPVHLNGTWAQSSDRASLLIAKDNDLQDLDHQKLNWNRYILLEFLPKVYCELLEEILKLQNNNEIDHKQYVSRLWPFPPITENYPKYIINYGLKVLQLILNCEKIFQLITSDYYISHNNNNVIFTGDNINVDKLFRCLSYSHVEAFHPLLRNNWSEIDMKNRHSGKFSSLVKRSESENSIKSMIRSLPIWPTRKNPSMPNLKVSLVPVSIGFCLPKDFKMYRPKGNKYFLRIIDDKDSKILRGLDAAVQEIRSYASEDVEYPEESDGCYVDFINDILTSGIDLVQDLAEKNCFPNAFTNDLRCISSLYDYNNIVFRTVHGGDSNNFLHLNLSEHAAKLVKIGFNNKIDQDSFIKCAVKVEELQEMGNPPSDIRYRGFILVDHLYKDISKFEYNVINRIAFVPIVKFLEKHYQKHYNHPQTLVCFKDIILPEYKEVAWSQKPLIAEDVLPPKHILEKYKSLGKPNVPTVIKHLNFLRITLIEDSEWKEWKETLIFNVFKVYKWLNEKCLNEGINMKEHINSNEPLFLNFKKNQDPFDTKNWVTITNLVLNAESNEEKYINPRLAQYHTMLRSAGVEEIKAPSFKIQVREHDQSNINQSTMLRFLGSMNHLNDVVFIVNEKKISASQYVLAASSKVFHQKFNTVDYAKSSAAKPINIAIENVSYSSVNILLHYLYGQDINDAIWNNQTSDAENLELYKNLLELANIYELDHLKDIMELKLSLLVSRSNMRELENLAQDLKADQLEKYCHCYISDNEKLFS